MSLVSINEDQISNVANNLLNSNNSVGTANKKIEAAFRILSVNEWINNVYDQGLLSEIRAASEHLSKQVNILQQLTSSVNGASLALYSEDQIKLTGCTTVPSQIGTKGSALAQTVPWLVGGLSALSAFSFEMPHLKGGSAIFEGVNSSSTVIGKVNISGTVSGELIGGTYDVSPTSVKAEGHLAKGAVSGNVGIASGSISGTVGKIEAKGSVGATLYDKDGKFTPNLAAEAKAEATALEGEAKVQIGNDQFNGHAKAKGKLATAKASAEVKAGVISVEDTETGEVYTTYGAEAKAGASAYLASGKVSGGVTVFGVKIDASVSGHAGGGGAEVGGAITSSSASGNIGAGLGLGAGVEVKIDWSDFKFGW